MILKNGVLLAWANCIRKALPFFLAQNYTAEALVNCKVIIEHERI